MGVMGGRRIGVVEWWGGGKGKDWPRTYVRSYMGTTEERRNHPRTDVRSYGGFDRAKICARIGVGRTRRPREKLHEKSNPEFKNSATDGTDKTRIQEGENGRKRTQRTQSG